MDPTVLKLGDACPGCGDTLKAVPVPSDEQWRKASDRENPVPLPPGYDTANPEQRADIGKLYRCPTCGYASRFRKPKAKPDAGAARDDE